MKYQFYAIVFDVAGNITPVGSSAWPSKSFVTNIQKVTGISISPSGSVTKNIGESFTISATVSPSDANNKTINWNSTNTNVATVDSNGKVSCLAAGSTTITATAADGSGKSASFALTVCNKVTISTFSYSSTSINVGQVTAEPSKAITGTAKSGPTYSSSNTNIATVASNGKVTGKAAGTATITISYTNYDGTTSTKTCNITVYNKVTITTFSYNTTGIDVGKTSAVPNKAITGKAKSGPTYTSSNTSIATVNSSTGVVTGIADGTTTITITYTNYDGTTATKTCSVKINGWLITGSNSACTGTVVSPASTSNPTVLQIANTADKGVNTTLQRYYPIKTGDSISVTYMYTRSNNSYYLDMVVQGKNTNTTWGTGSGLNTSNAGKTLTFNTTATTDSDYLTLYITRSDCPSAGYYVTMNIYEIKVNGTKVL